MYKFNYVLSKRTTACLFICFNFSVVDLLLYKQFLQIFLTLQRMNLKSSIIIVLAALMLLSKNNSAQNDTSITISGLKYIIIEKGTGEKAVTGKEAAVHYTGYLLNGFEFDSSIPRKAPIEFTLGKGMVIKGWDEGISLMSIGDKMRLIIPSNLAYGEKGSGDVIPPNSTLIFDVELVGLTDPKTPIYPVLEEIVLNESVEKAIEKYKELKKNSPDDYNFKESQLNTLGYRLMRVQMMAEAIKIFEFNAEQFPESSNVYDSLGEAYMHSEKLDEAVKCYEKSLELNPENSNAKLMIQKLSGM